MDTFNHSLLGELFQHPVAWIATALAALLYYVSLPQATVYGRFARKGGTIFQWTAIHNTVADAYKSVRSTRSIRCLQ